jgi:hypothetical protein
VPGGAAPGEYRFEVSTGADSTFAARTEVMGR